MIAPFLTTDWIVQDNVIRIDLSRFKFVISIINECGPFCPGMYEESGTKTFRDLHLTIFDDPDFQPSYIDFWTEGQGNERDVQTEENSFQCVMAAIQQDMGINKFLNYDDVDENGKKVVKTVNLPKKNLEKVILTLQGSGERFTAENITKNYFALDHDYRKLKEIAEMRAKIYDCVDHQVQDYRGWLNAMENENDQFWNKYNIGRELPGFYHHYNNDLQSSIRAARRQLALQNFKFASDNREGDWEHWFEEQISVLDKSLDETNEKLLSALKDKKRYLLKKFESIRSIKKLSNHIDTQKVRQTDIFTKSSSTL